MAGGVVKHGREAGFTLIEIILVLILMGLLAAVGASRMSYLQAPDATTEHQKALMVARIAHARNEAIMQDDTVYIKVTGGNTLQYHNMTPLSGESNKGKVSDDTVVTLTDVTLSSSEGSGFTLYFNNDFSYSGPKQITVTSNEDTSKHSTLTISEVGYVQ